MRNNNTNKLFRDDIRYIARQNVRNANIRDKIEQSKHIRRSWCQYCSLQLIGEIEQGLYPHFRELGWRYCNSHRQFAHVATSHRQKRHFNFQWIVTRPMTSETPSARLNMNFPESYSNEMSRSILVWSELFRNSETRGMFVSQLNERNALKTICHTKIGVALFPSLPGSFLKSLPVSRTALKRLIGMWQNNFKLKLMNK